MTDEEKKKLYIYVLIAALIGGGGSTGIQMLLPGARNDPFIGREAKELRAYLEQRHAESIKGIEVLHKRITDLKKEVYSKEQEQQLHDVLWLAVNENKEEISEFRKDIRIIFENIAKLPPQELLRRMTVVEAELKFMRLELSELIKRLSDRR